VSPQERASIRAYAKELVNLAPELKPETRDKLAAILRQDSEMARPPGTNSLDHEPGGRSPRSRSVKPRDAGSYAPERTRDAS
jgi:hypothetical protein